MKKYININSIPSIDYASETERLVMMNSLIDEVYEYINTVPADDIKQFIIDIGSTLVQINIHTSNIKKELTNIADMRATKNNTTYDVDSLCFAVSNIFLIMYKKYPTLIKQITCTHYPDIHERWLRASIADHINICTYTATSVLAYIYMSKYL